MNGTVRISAVCALWLLFSQSALAQTFPPSLTELSCPAGQERVWTVGGVEDDFDPSTNTELMTPSAETVIANTWTFPALSHYDSQQTGRKLVETLELNIPANATVTSMRISGDFGPAQSVGPWLTDILFFAQIRQNGIDGFNRLLFNRYALDLGASGAMVWDINNAITATPSTSPEPGGATAQEVLDAVTEAGFIDVWISGDTSVDYLALEACVDVPAIDIEMNKTADQNQVQVGDLVNFDFDFTVVAGEFEAGDQLTVTDRMPNGFRQENLPRFSDGDDWDCSVTFYPHQSAHGGRTIDCTSAPGLTSIPPLRISAERVGIQTGVHENCADLTVLRSNGDGDIEPANNTGRCDIVTVLGQPDFAIEKSLETCSAATGPSPVTCIYSITVSNSGSPYSGSVTIQEFMNVGGVEVSITDPSGASMICQEFSNSGQTNQLTTSSGHTINTDGTSLCTADAVTIDNAPQTFTATVAFDPNIHYGPDPIAINCAGLVMWDDRPSLNSIQQNGGFPGDCVPAMDAMDCDLSITKTAMSDAVVDTALAFGITVRNESPYACSAGRIRVTEQYPQTPAGNPMIVFDAISGPGWSAVSSDEFEFAIPAMWPTGAISQMEITTLVRNIPAGYSAFTNCVEITSATRLDGTPMTSNIDNSLGCIEVPVGQCSIATNVDWGNSVLTAGMDYQELRLRFSNDGAAPCDSLHFGAWFADADVSNPTSPTLDAVTVTEYLAADYPQTNWQLTAPASTLAWTGNPLGIAEWVVPASPGPLSYDSGAVLCVIAGETPMALSTNATEFYNVITPTVPTTVNPTAGWANWAHTINTDLATAQIRHTQCAGFDLQ